MKPLIAAHFWHVFGEVAKWIGIGLVGFMVFIGVLFCIFCYIESKRPGSF